MLHIVIDRYFSLFLEGLKIFLNPWRSLIVPLSGPGCNQVLTMGGGDKSCREGLVW